MNPETHREIEALHTQKTKALKVRYRELFGEESRSSNHAHLFRRIAWRLQSLAPGRPKPKGARARGSAGRRCRSAPSASTAVLEQAGRCGRALAQEATRSASSCPGNNSRTALPGQDG